MKAVMLCAGLGTRLRPLTFTTAKHLLPVANKPVLFYGIENLTAVGIEEIGLIVSPESKAVLQNCVGDGSRWKIRVTYIEQDAPRGLAHACGCAESFIGGEPFVMYLGDNFIPGGIAEAVELFRSSGAAAVVMLKEVADPRAFGIAHLADGRIVKLVEKPKNPESNLAIVGGYLFQPSIFESIRRIQPSWRGELEITDAIQNLIDRGLTVLPYIVPGYWKDAGKPRDILDANRAVLDQLPPSNHGVVDAASRIEGVVQIGAGAVIERSTVVGPVVLGDGARVTDSRLGPYTSVGDRVHIAGCHIEDSVIMEDCALTSIERPIRGSLIGRKVVLKGSTEDVRLVVGDQCEIDL